MLSNTNSFYKPLSDADFEIFAGSSDEEFSDYQATNDYSNSFQTNIFSPPMATRKSDPLLELLQLNNIPVPHSYFYN
jgi:hypothetical protein